MEDVRWLGFEWDGLFYASDYFGQLYEWAIQLVKAGKAYVCDLSADEVRAYRGTLTEPGKESPFRKRSVEESLDLFERMKKGEFPDGSRTLRAKIDMSSPNLNLRDPVMYRILHMEHHRTGDEWCIYPMYDYAHGQSDSIEKVTHSICTLEFENNRPLYNWFIEQLSIFPSQQFEFDASCWVWFRKDMSKVGTIRGCQLCRGCVGAAIRRKPSEAFAQTRASPRQTTPWSCRLSSITSAKI
jgi:glutaminyl-tRNA synthetase